MRLSIVKWFLLVAVLLLLSAYSFGQAITASIQGRVYDTSGAVIPKANVTAVNTATGFSRTATADQNGNYQFTTIPVGEYNITAEAPGFKKQAKKVQLEISQTGAVDFNLPLGQVTQEVEVQAEGELAEPTRTTVSSVISETQIQQLPVNGRQFIDFALLAPGVTVGDTTSGSTDVIIEPVTKLSFAGQNIHYNFVAIDGADNMSTASGIQKTTPSQEAVREFQVVNSDYSTVYGRAVGGIVNVITKSGTNDLHGAAYEYFRNDKMDAKNPLVSPNLATCKVPGDPFSGGCTPLDKLRQNQFGFTLGGPIVKNKTFFFGNYEGQRHREAPFYNSVILQHLDCSFTVDPRCGTPSETVSINQVKVNTFHLAPENLNVTRNIDYDNFLLKLDHNFNANHYMFLRYFFNDQNSTNLSPLNDGFDLPSGFKNNNFRDQSFVANLTSTFSGNMVNEARVQYAHRFFNFPTVSTQPHLEVSNTFTVGVNRGNPDFYEEGRWEIVDNLTKVWGRHTTSWGGDFNHVTSTESFPLFYPFEGDFGGLDAFLGTDFVGAPHPFVIFFQRFQAPNFNEPTLANFQQVYAGGAISSAVRNQAKGTLDHTYEGLYIQDKWRASDHLTVNYGLRWEGETWPSAAVNNVTKNFDPRAGFSYALGTKRNFIIRGGAGLFHGTIPSPLLMCQIPSCGGQKKYPGRESIQDSLNSTTALFAAGADPFTNAANLAALLTTGTYPSSPLDATIVRFAQKHKPPYGAQMSFGFEVQPIRDTVLDVTYLHVRGIHLGSFWNVNQPNPSIQYAVHDSKGNVGLKDYYCPLFPMSACLPGVGFGVIPGIRTPPFGVDFEADSKWDSQWDGLLVNFNKRMSHHFEFGTSYTYSKGIDNGPNPSFVLIPQDSCFGDPSCSFRRERAVSADSVKHRFVFNTTIEGPTHLNRVLNNFRFGTIITLESPHYFTKFAGFDANGDIFGNNDRVGIEPRDTFKGDTYQTIDLRVSRTFGLTERFHLETIAEGFNMLNKRNIRFFNTAYGAADFCPIGGVAQGCPGPGAPSFLEGSPNPNYGTPRAVFNPRQIQLALRLSF